MWVVFPLFPSVIIHSLQLWHANSNIFLFLFGFRRKDVHSFAVFKKKEKKRKKKSLRPIKDSLFEIEQP